MAAAVKAAAFAAFLRVWIECLGTLDYAWFRPIWWLAAFTMIVGNVVALSQRNIKRMLAYSSIVHSGYLLVAVAAGTEPRRVGVPLLPVRLHAGDVRRASRWCPSLGRPGERDLEITDYEGLWTVRPAIAVGMSICLLALLGFPIFGGIGFFAKWYLLQAALASPYPMVPLSVLLVVTSVVSAGYYLHVIRVMFMRPRAEGAAPPPRMGPLSCAVLATSVILILILGLVPGRLATWARTSAPVAATALGVATAP